VVSAEAPAIGPPNATMSGLVSSEQIRDLPLTGQKPRLAGATQLRTFADRTASPRRSMAKIHLSINGIGRMQCCIC